MVIVKSSLKGMFTAFWIKKNSKRETKIGHQSRYCKPGFPDVALKLLRADDFHASTSFNPDSW